MPPDEEPVREYNETLAHARAGYANAQDVIKFIDAKTGVVTGLITLMLGAPLVVFQWLAEQEEEAFISLTGMIATSPISAGLSLAILAIGLLGGIFGLWAAVRGILPRPPNVRKGVSILFPMFHPKAGKRTAASSLRRLRVGLSQKEILREYELQLFQVGRILHEKMFYLNKSGKWFAVQITAYVASLATLAAGSLLA